MTQRSPHILLLGGGGHAAVVAETARIGGRVVVGYLSDEQPDRPVGDLSRLGAIDDLERALRSGNAEVAVHAAVGDNALRAEWYERFAAHQWTTIVHPTAIISPSAEIESGVFIGPGAIVNARARIDAGTIINSGAIVEHDCVIAECSHVAPRVALGGEVRVNSQALVGIGAVARPGVTIGRKAVVGAGSVIVNDVTAEETVVGNPARPLAVSSPI